MLPRKPCCHNRGAASCSTQQGCMAQNPAHCCSPPPQALPVPGGRQTSAPDVLRSHLPGPSQPAASQPATSQPTASPLTHPAMMSELLAPGSNSPTASSICPHTLCTASAKPRWTRAVSLPRVTAAGQPGRRAVGRQRGAGAVDARVVVAPRYCSQAASLTEQARPAGWPSQAWL